MWIGILGLGVAAVTWAYLKSERSGYAELNDILAHQSDLYAAALDSELGRYEYLPSIVALETDVQALLAAPASRPLTERANKRLANMNVRAGSLAIFVADKAGLVLAASNWYQPQSFVGRDLSGLPYFANALRDGRAHFFSRNASRDSPEYYFAQPVLNNGDLLGVVVVKISLDPIESTWIASASQSNHEIFLILDEHDAIIIASAPEWRSKKSAMAAMLRRARLPQPGQANAQALPSSAPIGQAAAELTVPNDTLIGETVEHGNQVVRWPGLDPAARPMSYLTETRFMPRQGWRLVTLANASNVTVNAWKNAFGTGVLAAFIALLGMYQVQRRRAIASRLRAREALQRAHDELELRITERTTELHNMNQELLREIAERKHAELVLRESQDELIHASRLALLGQISVGITHEISQPLTALRSLSFNTQLLFKRGDVKRIEKNLQSITDLTERIGRLTEQLKSLSRKTALALEAVALTKAVDNTLLLLENRIRSEQITLHVDIAQPVLAWCDGNRLEQILINLCANALDAMRDAPVKILEVQVWRADGKALIRVSDSGTGIPAASMDRLFEPFFSTKPPGQGLGLGLAISADIAREFGGTLRAFNTARGAAFELALKLVEEDNHV